MHDDLELTDKMGFTFNYLNVEKEWLRDKVTRLARDRLFTDLASRVAGEDGRRDLKGITWNIDYWATTARLRNVVCSKLLVDKIPELGSKLGAVETGRLRAIQQGGIRTGYRLKHGVTATDQCVRCGKENEDAKHVFWDCRHNSYENIRQKYLPSIHEINNAMGLFPVEGAERYIDLLEYSPFLFCGIVPEDSRVKLYEKQVENGKKLVFEEVPTEGHFSEWWENGRRMVYGDGSVLIPQDPRFSRAGSGVFYGHEHPSNLAEPTMGEVQNSYTAELYALLMAVEKTSTPMHYVADNRAVVEQAEGIAEDKRLARKADLEVLKSGCSWMWKRVALRVAAKPRGFFQFSWQKGHVKESFPELIEKGIYTQEQADWNDEADKLAAIGAERHKVDEGIVRGAGMRSNIAQAVHAMYVELWSERMKDKGMEAELAEEEAGLEMESGFDQGESEHMADLFGDSFGLDGDLGGVRDGEIKKSKGKYSEADVDGIEVVSRAEHLEAEGSYLGLSNKQGEASLSKEPTLVKGDLYIRAWKPGSSYEVGQGNKASSDGSTSNSRGSLVVKNSSNSLELMASPYSRLAAQHPRYPWGKPGVTSTSRLPTGPALDSWGGRQVMRSGANHSFKVILWEPFIKYLNLLLWGEEEEGKEQEGGEGSCSYLEWVIDFELYTGLRVEDKTELDSTTWARKAAVFACLYKAAIKYHNGPLAQEKIPSARIQALLPFGVQGKFNSLGKRPLFLMKKKTEEMFARNALEWAKAPVGRQEYRLKYNLIKLPPPYWVDPNEKRLSELLKTRMEKREMGSEEKGRKRHRLKGKQKPKYDVGKCGKQKPQQLVVDRTVTENTTNNGSGPELDDINKLLEGLHGFICNK